MRVLISAPSHRSFIYKFLDKIDIGQLPVGKSGANFISILIEELLKLNHQVVALTTTVARENDYVTKSFSEENFKWIVVPSRPHSIRMNGNKLGRILDGFKYETKQMSNIIKDEKPDIVHAHWSYEFSAAALCSGYPFLTTVHDNPYQVLRYIPNIYRFGRLIMSEFILRKVKYTSTVSPYMQPYLLKRCSNVRIIPNPVRIKYSLEKVNSFITKRSIKLGSPKIIMINNGWDKRKNVKTALRSFKIFRDKIPGAELHLFGEGYGPDGPAEEKSRILNNDQVFFHGCVSNQKLLSEIEDAHVLLHSSLEESFGVVLIEVMSLGIPVIGGVKSGAVPWVVAQEKCLVDVSNFKLIAEKLISMISDVKTYIDISKKSFKNVSNRFESSIIIEKYLDYYKEVMVKSYYTKSK